MLPTYKINLPNEKMTYKEWERLHRRRESRKKAEKLFYTRQKIFGFFIVLFSIILSFCIGTIIPFFLFSILGFFMVFTKKKICTF